MYAVFQGVFLRIKALLQRRAAQRSRKSWSYLVNTTSKMSATRHSSTADAEDSKASSPPPLPPKTKTSVRRNRRRRPRPARQSPPRRRRFMNHLQLPNPVKKKKRKTTRISNRRIKNSSLTKGRIIIRNAIIRTSPTGAYENHPISRIVDLRW